MIIKTHFKTKLLISKKFISGKIYIRPKKKYMSVYGYILQKNRVGRSDSHFILFFHFILHTEIPDCEPIRIRTLEYI